MKNNRRTRRVNNRSILPVRNRRPVDPIITPQRFQVPSAHVPQHLTSPSVTRIIRLFVTLTSGVPTYQITPLKLASQDAIDYLGTSAVLRYTTMRAFQLRAWAESPASLSVSQPTYGLIVIDGQTNFTIADRPTTGSRLNAIGLRLPFIVRTTTFLTTNNAYDIATIACDQNIAASTDFNVTIDVSCEFYG